MLVFTRRRDEAIVIGDGIEVRIVRTGKDAVRIGVTAPANVPVHRREVYDAVGRANRTAAGAPLPELSAIARRLKLHPPLEPVE
ncbi:MAG: carbon storage regulator [Vicinamibacterales bacterium]